MSLRTWGYYAFHTFWNSIRKMFRSKIMVVLAVVFLISALFGGAIGVLVATLEDEFAEGDTELPTDREGYGDPEYGMFNESGEFLFYEDLVEEGLGGYDEDGNFIYYEDAFNQGLGYYDEYGDFIFYYEEITDEELMLIFKWVEAGVVILVFVLLFTGAYSGMKKGSDIFTMADVNFLFTAPIKPQSVLLFRLTFQMLAVFAGSIYLLFQIPNLVINAGIPLEVCLIFFLAFVLVTIYQKLFSVGMYTYTATHEKARKLALPVIIAICAVLLGAIGLVFVSTGMDVEKTLDLTLASEWSRIIPIVGWSKAIVIYAVEEKYWLVLFYVLLSIAGMVGLVALIWRMEADFYEDAMTGAQAREDILLAAQENRKAVEINTDGKKKKDKRQVKDMQLALFEKSKGAVVFFAKELIVRKRLAKFGLITNTMIWYFVISAGLSVLFTNVLDFKEFAVIGFITMFVMFFRNYGNPIASETSMNWLFLVPESPYKKVFFAMMAGSYSAFLDLLPGFMVAMLLMEVNPFEILLWYVVLLTMDFMLSAVGMLLEALFPATAMDTVKASLQLMLKFVVIIFIVIGFVIGLMLGGITAGLFGILLVNLVLGAVSFIIYPSMLHGGIA